MDDVPQAAMGWNGHGQMARPPVGAFHSARSTALHEPRTSSRAGFLHPGLNLFRRTEEQDIICAISEDRPVPIFLQDPAWTFAGRLDWETATVPGFDLRAARSACNSLGFYLFQTWARA